MNTNPKFKETDEYRALEAAAEAQRQKLEEGGHANAIEKSDSMGVSMENVQGIAAVMAVAVEGFAALAKREEAFRAEWAPKIAAAPQSVECDIHELTRRPIDIDGTYNAIRPTRKLEIVYAPCAQCEAENKAARKRNYWRRQGVEERNINATFGTFVFGGPAEDAKRSAVAAVRNWCEARGNYLVLVGSNGTGKGFLATAALKWQGSGIFVRHLEMLAELRASYQEHTTQEVVAKWQDCEMLAVDEFGLSPGGRDEEPLLFQVFADRYDKRRPTIITTNLTQAELREALGQRLLDRIRADMKQVVMNWESYRTQ